MIPMKRPGLLAAGAVALALASGCVTKPVVTLHHAEVRAASLEGLALDVVLKIDNPNPYDVEVRSVHAEVTIAGRYALAPIDVQPKQWLGSNSTTMVSVPVAVPWSMIPAL